MPSVADLRGLWQRSLIAWPDGRRDTTTEVRWLQGLRAYADLRQPSPAADFSHVRRRADLSMDDCAWLARQQGFAGNFTFDGRHFEWIRSIDIQPKAARADAGTLEWDGQVLVEKGRDIAYIEHWHRDPLAVTEPCAALVLRETSVGTRSQLLRVGSAFIFARDRAVPLPEHLTLGECVAAAGTVQQAQALLDCEISFGSVALDGFRITASSLPYRIGDFLAQSLTHDTVSISDRDARGTLVDRRWEIVDGEGDIGSLRARGATP
jgi:hypothetical protein